VSQSQVDTGCVRACIAGNAAVAKAHSLRRLYFDFRYLFRPPWDTGQSPPELLEYLAAHKPGRALDLGCGTGTNVLTMARCGWLVTGLDFSPRAIRAARRKLQSAGVAATVSVADVNRTLEPLEPYDLVLDIGCFHSLGNPRGYLENLQRLLRPGGSWLLYGFLRAPGQPYGPGIDPQELSWIGSCGLQLVSRTDGVGRAGRPSAWFRFEMGANSSRLPPPAG